MNLLEAHAPQTDADDLWGDLRDITRSNNKAHKQVSDLLAERDALKARVAELEHKLGKYKEFLGLDDASIEARLLKTEADLIAVNGRVVELEAECEEYAQECEEYEQQMSVARSLYLKVVDGLAAARAEIEQLKAVINADDRQRDPSPLNVIGTMTLYTPKETNNG